MLGENLGPQKAFPHLLILALVGHLVLAAGAYARGPRLLLRGNGEHGGSVTEGHRRVLGRGERDRGAAAGRGGDGAPLAPVTFDVKGACKGVSRESVAVHGQGPGVSCGLDFERGET